MKTTTSYSNRTVDLSILKSPTGTEGDIIVNPDVSLTPMMVTGVQKLVQRFATTFLTIKGTVENYSDFGTPIMQKALSGGIYSEATFTTAAAEANALAFRQIREADEDLDTPDDEKLESSDIINLSLDRGSGTLSVTIELTTAAGAIVTFVTPLETGI